MDAVVDEPPVLDLATLNAGLGRLTPAAGANLAEAAAVCLEDRGHEAGVQMNVDGDEDRSFRLSWPPATADARATHANEKEATEDGACALALLLVREILEMVVVARAETLTGCDYWIGPAIDGQLPFQGAARLEVSGIRDNVAEIPKRMKDKLVQVEKFMTDPPGVAVVVEFGTPQSRMEHA